MSTYIDLNCDMGESFGAWTMGADADVMPWVTSANIACGFHAGDPVTMRATVKSAAEANVAIGAHIGLPDKQGFGRRAMAISADEVYAMTVVQLGSIMAMARTFKRDVTHLKPHGALYHMVEKQPELCEAIVAATAAVDRRVRIVGLAGGQLVRTAQSAELQVAHEGFVDRQYQPDGSLMPRSRKGAVIEDGEEALEQAISLVLRGQALLADGSHVCVQATTLCIHGDRADAASFARKIHDGLRAAGVELQALSAK